jgi:hypothetical protein
MAKRARKPAEPRPTTRISRGGEALPIADNGLAVPPPIVTPEDPEVLMKRGLLIAVLYAELGSYAKVADAFQLSESTVRWWVHKMRKERKESLGTIAAQLRGDVAQLAVDRIQEGLVEGETEFAAMLATKVLHGIGELKSHSAVKQDTSNTVTTLTLNITRSDPTIPVPDIVAGAVLGRPRELSAAQTSAEAVD